MAAAIVRLADRGSFEASLSAVKEVPTWYLTLTIVIVAAGEEWLYRAYAIERLATLTGSFWIAGGISVLAFALAHLPVWGPGLALSTLVSGAVMTALYVWRRDITFLIVAHVATDFYGLVVATLLRTGR